MESKIDFEAIAQQATYRLLELCQEWFPNGKREGREYKVGSLAGEPGRSLSINLQTGVWKDFSSDSGGSNPITLYAAKNCCTNGVAAKAIAERIGSTSTAIVPAQKSDWMPLHAAPRDCTPTHDDLKHFKFGFPTQVYEYWTEDGCLHGVVCRWDLDSGKEILPMSYCEKEGKFAWKFKAFQKPRQLFGIPQLLEKPEAKVLVVEGEKTALSARCLFPKAAIVSWAGGSKAVKYTDWSLLAERDVYLWPDNDAAGIQAMQEVAEVLSGSKAKVFIVEPPTDKPDGWDLADAYAESLDSKWLAPFLKNAKSLFLQAPQQIEEGKICREEQNAVAEIVEPIHVDSDEDHPVEPFKILGHSDGHYYYLRKSTQSIHCLCPSAHTKLELIAIAPANYWEQTYPAKDGADWFAAANSLIQRASSVDFNPNQIRGRGAWLDDGRTVFHAGKCLYVDQHEIPLDGFATEYTYKKGQKLEADLIEPLSSAESQKLVSLLLCIQFRNRLDSFLLAGWLALAPVCGALEWRPHLWLTGPSGSGKSWLLSQIVRPILGNCACYFQSVSTSAGIRQTLGCDALPVVFDEAETERESDQRRMQEVIILARQASRESDGRIAKGTSNGSALTWHIRSCFLFASIGLGATQRADLSRITCLDLLPENQRTEDNFPQALEIQKSTVRIAEWASAFRARSVRLANVIAKNCAFFKDAVHDHLGNQRDADQFGSLMAGVYSLFHTDEVTEEGARFWVAQFDWKSFLSSDLERDEAKCLALLLEANLVIQNENEPPKRTTVMELIAVNNDAPWASEAAKGARSALERHGIAVRKDFIDVANSHEELSKIFRQTPFTGKWSELLKRLPGASKIEAAKILGITKRVVRIPLSVIIVEPED